MTPPIFISLKPQFADLVFQGRKKVELRRRIVSHVENSYMFVLRNQSNYGVARGVSSWASMVWTS